LKGGEEGVKEERKRFTGGLLLTRKVDPVWGGREGGSGFRRRRGGAPCFLEASTSQENVLRGGGSKKNNWVGREKKISSTETEKELFLPREKMWGRDYAAMGKKVKKKGQRSKRKRPLLYSNSSLSPEEGEIIGNFERLGGREVFPSKETSPFPLVGRNGRDKFRVQLNPKRSAE